VEKGVRRDRFVFVGKIPDAERGRVHQAVILDDAHRKARQFLLLNQLFEYRLELLVVPIGRRLRRCGDCD